MSKIYSLGIFFLTLFFVSTFNYNANATSITPVAIEINDEVKINSITYTNTSKFEVLVQPSQKLWTQEGGKDKYTDTSDLLIVPSFVKIAPGQKQVFRVTKRDKNEAEPRAYRLILEDVSDDVSEALSENQAGNIRFKFNHNLPVYFYPKIAKKNSYEAKTSFGPASITVPVQVTQK